MILADVNIHLQAFRRDAANHAICSHYVTSLLEGRSAFSVSTLVLSAVVRIATNPRVYAQPSQPEAVLEHCKIILESENCVQVQPGPRHWALFADLVVASGVRGALVPDAYFAALAIEHGCEWVTLDKDFGKFPGLKWRLVK